jgi:uncharacterized membrane protein
MVQLLRTAEAQLVILLAVLLIASAVAWYLVARFRDRIDEDESASDLLTKFREMHHRGDLSQAEYRTIKTMLAEKLQDEINDGGETG